MTDKSLIILFVACIIWSFGFGVWIECNFHIGHMEVSNWFRNALIGFLLGMVGMKLYYLIKEDLE